MALGGDVGAATAKEFRTAFTTLQSETERHQQHQGRAEQARARLAQDDQLRNKHAPAIRDGQAAAQTMRLRLHTTIAEAIGAIGEAALLPVWFITALGPTSPQGDADRWLDIATEVVAYRFTYDVTNQMIALGTKPDGNNPDRYWQHQELIDKLRRYSS